MLEQEVRTRGLWNKWTTSLPLHCQARQNCIVATQRCKLQQRISRSRTTAKEATTRCNGICDTASRQYKVYFRRNSLYMYIINYNYIYINISTEGTEYSTQVWNRQNDKDRLCIYSKQASYIYMSVMIWGQTYLPKSWMREDRDKRTIVYLLEPPLAKECWSYTRPPLSWRRCLLCRYKYVTLPLYSA